MSRMASLLFLLLVFAACSNAYADERLLVANRMGRDICEFYISAHAEDDWGDYLFESLEGCLIMERKQTSRGTIRGATPPMICGSYSGTGRTGSWKISVRRPAPAAQGLLSDSKAKGACGKGGRFLKRAAGVPGAFRLERPLTLRADAGRFAVPLLYRIPEGGRS